eukprot:jgi/Ulvmu1/6002/UM026_0128.1
MKSATTPRSQVSAPGTAYTASLPVARQLRQVSCQAETQTQPPLPPVTEPVLKLNLWQKYCQSLETNPFVTKACTSLVGFMLGDCLAQRLEGDDLINITRVLRLGAYGMLLDGPVGHLWYKWLDGTVDRSFENPKGTAAVAIKTSADQLIWAPIMTAVFFAFVKLLEGTPDLIVPTLQTKVLPTVAANYVIWPAAHVISFKYVPSHQRILYNNVIAIFWNAYLSIVAADSGMDGNQVADAAAAMQGAGDSLVGLGEIAGRVQDTLPFGGFWLQDMLSLSGTSTFALAPTEASSAALFESLVKMQSSLIAP